MTLSCALPSVQHNLICLVDFPFFNVSAGILVRKPDYAFHGRDSMQRTESVHTEGVKKKARKLKYSNSLAFVSIRVPFQD